MKRLAIALGLAWMGASARADVEALSDDEYTAFAAHGNEVQFLVQSNKWVHAFGTNATLRVRVDALACTRRMMGNGLGRAVTDQRVVVKPQFRRKAKPVPKPSEVPDPEIDVDI